MDLKNFIFQDSEFRSSPFWAWNGALDPQVLCSQIESMKKAGIGGFFMHPRSGLKTPFMREKFMECVDACIEKARQLDMKPNLYDEDRYSYGF